jgi:hypothetical protein
MWKLGDIDDGEVSSCLLRLKKQRSVFVSQTGQL